MDDVTFASLLTPGGAVVAAGIITTLVELLKRVRDPLPGTGASWAFGLSAALYVVAAVATSVGSLDAGLAVFLAWLACATSAVGIHGAVTTASRTR